MPIHGCAVFITMNPGYAGRSELPDNLKALFRPCAMTVPSYDTIAEISLYSYGFLHPRVCAAKMVRTLSLLSEQLSSQNHYDFGMRTIKSVVVAAGELKRKDATGTEVGIAFRALVDCNTPKIVTADLPVFEGITKDLFPDGAKTKDQEEEATAAGDADAQAFLEMANTQVQASVRRASSRRMMRNREREEEERSRGSIIALGAASIHIPLRTGVEVQCGETLLQPTPKFIFKCVQLYETLQVRHGVMLIGETMVGKSAIRSTLNATLHDIHKGALDAEARVKEIDLKWERRMAEREGNSGEEEDEEWSQDDEDEDDERELREKAALSVYGPGALERNIYPKSLSLKELYGSFDPASHEWSDGVLAVAFRRAIEGERSNSRPSAVAADKKAGGTSSGGGDPTAAPSPSYADGLGLSEDGQGNGGVDDEGDTSCSTSVGASAPGSAAPSGRPPKTICWEEPRGRGSRRR